MSSATALCSTIAVVVLTNVASSHAADDGAASETEFLGVLAPYEEVIVPSHTGGEVAGVRFEPGDFVKKGDLLFQIDPRFQELHVARAKARLEVVRSQVVRQVAQLERRKTLVAKGAVTDDELKEAEVELDVLKGEMQVAEIELELEEQKLSFHQIRAPITGRTGLNEVGTGAVVSAGKSLVTIISSDPIKVLFDVDQETFVRLRDRTGKELKAAGLRVQILVAGENSKKYEGQVNFIDNRFDPATGTIRFSALIDNRNGRLLPGMQVKVRLSFPS